MTTPTSDTREMLHFQRSLLNLSATVEALEDESVVTPRPDAKAPVSEHGSILELWARRLEQSQPLAS
jgi:hypothetical protein